MKSRVFIIITLLAFINIFTFSCKKNTTESEADPLAIQLVPTHVSIYGGSDGSIDLSILGGTGPFQYQWSNGVTTEDIANLTTGMYSVTVTDLEEQTETDSVFITEPAQNNGNIVTDIDGNVYNTVTIGTQTWMAENLKTTKLNNGEIIPHILDGVAWENLNTHGYCFYDNDTINIDGYGAIYNWYAINTGILAPLGWHIPTLTEIEILMATVNNNGNALKSVGQGTGSGAGTNTSGFSALLSGVRVGGLGYFNRGFNTYFWSSSEDSDALAHTMNLHYLDSNINLMPKLKNEGFSVRCLRD